MKASDRKKVEQELLKIDSSFDTDKLGSVVKVLSSKKPEWPDPSKSKANAKTLLEDALKKQKPKLALVYRYAMPFTAAAAVLLVVVTGSWYWLSNSGTAKSAWKDDIIPATEKLSKESDRNMVPDETTAQQESDLTLKDFATEGSIDQDHSATYEDLKGNESEKPTTSADGYTANSGILYLPSATDEKAETGADLKLAEVSSAEQSKTVAPNSDLDKMDDSVVAESKKFKDQEAFFSQLEKGVAVSAGPEAFNGAMDLVLYDLVPENAMLLMPAFSSQSALIVLRGNMDSSVVQSGFTLEKENQKAKFVPLVQPKSWKAEGNKCQLIGEKITGWDAIRIDGASETDLGRISQASVSNFTKSYDFYATPLEILKIQLSADSSEAALTEWALMVAGYLPKQKVVLDKILNQMYSDPRILPKIQSIVLMSSYLFK